MICARSPVPPGTVASRPYSALCAIPRGGGTRQPSPTVTAPLCVRAVLSPGHDSGAHAVAKPSAHGVFVLYGSPLFDRHYPITADHAELRTEGTERWACQDRLRDPLHAI